MWADLSHLCCSAIAMAQAGVIRWPQLTPPESEYLLTICMSHAVYIHNGGFPTQYQYVPSMKGKGTCNCSRNPNCDVDNTD